LEAPDPASDPNPAPELTDRELEVLRLLEGGKSDQEIADALFIGRETATTHVRHIRRKLGVQSRGAAVAYAIRHGLI
jgi:two-component system, NarL family, response regulator LiaR